MAENASEATHSSTPPETALNFPDNRLLIDLCGEFDRNLAQVEQAMGVTILRRGNELAIVGPEDARALAGQALGVMYTRLEEGRSLEKGDIDAAIRFGDADDSEVVASVDQLEMFKDGKLEIRTRKKAVSLGPPRKSNM